MHHKTFRLFLLTLSFWTVSQGIFAQDKQFTQFYASPLTLNPALTGAFEGRYRVSSIYRDQWGSVLDEPFQSYAVAGDFRFTPRKKRVVEDAIGLGLVFDNDRIGVLDFNTTQIGLSLAYHKSLNADNDQYLSAGLQAGITQRNLNYASLRFHDQFDGVNGYTGATQEDLPGNNFAYLDLSLGINYTAKLGKRSNLFAGVSYHHFNQPVIAFDRTELVTGERLLPRYSAQFAANMPIGSRSTRVSFLPRVLVSSQGTHLQTNAGTNFRFALGEFRTSAFHLGSWLRPVRSEQGFNLDAAVVLVGFELNNVLFGMSYDLNLQALNARQRQGAFEISIAYLGSFESEGIACPKF
jgi:type IX secretion system PorP/SprF family membrane protein